MINLTREEAQQVLDALDSKYIVNCGAWRVQRDAAIELLRARLAQPEPEPVAWMWDVYNGAGYSSRGIGFYQTDIPFAKHTPLYTAPPQREWVGLTDEEYEAMAEQYVTNCYFDTLKYAKAIEANLKEKNAC